MSKKNKEKVAVAEEAPQAPNATQKNEKNELPEPSPLELLQDEMEKEKDRYLRLFAEFENYKRRTGKERLELFKTASQDVMVSLLPILDDFERALKEIEKSEEDTLFKGVELIHHCFSTY